jgi:SpoVK/Ycf46/Vps4 family AAA+-type ATPase
MLTQLNDLRRQQSCIFIVATNRLRSFDAAVTRPGRFDLLLFVGTPNLSARVERLKSKLSKVRLSVDERDAIIALVSDHLDSRWETLRFLTFAENEIFLNSCVDFALRGELTRSNVATISSTIQRTATIQGAIKEDYIASELLSRVC